MAYYPVEAAHMPLPEYYQHQQPYIQQPYLPTPPPPPPPPPPPQYAYQNGSQPVQGYRPYGHLLEEQAPQLPPRPPKTPIESTNTLHVPPPKPPRPHSTSCSIEPDPLPPHSNPEALTRTQSHAFESASPVPPVRIGNDEVWSSETGFALYVVTREAAHMPSFLSSKPLLTVKKADSGQTMGTIRFHSVSTSAIDMTINRRQTSISHSGVIHNRWGFQSTTCPNVDAKWYWKKDKASGSVKLEDAKKSGKTLARIKGDLLTFETVRLNNANCDEVLLSAIAMAEAARRQRKGKEIRDLADAIGNFADSSGGDGGGGGGDGGGGGGGGGA